jgi:hypothetical protein
LRKKLELLLKGNAIWPQVNYVWGHFNIREALMKIPNANQRSLQLLMIEYKQSENAAYLRLAIYMRGAYPTKEPETQHPTKEPVKTIRGRAAAAKAIPAPSGTEVCYANDLISSLLCFSII